MGWAPFIAQRLYSFVPADRITPLITILRRHRHPRQIVRHIRMR